MFPREVLLALAQWDFRWVPGPVADCIATLFKGFGHSLINENANNQVKDQLRDNKGNKLAREKRYYIPIVKGLISSRYKRPELTFAAASAAATADRSSRPRIINQRAFESQAGPHSIDTNLLRQITAKETWPTFSALSAHHIVSAC